MEQFVSLILIILLYFQPPTFVRKLRKTFYFFLLQYLGCVEVFESRGMQTCEEALRVMKVNIIQIFIDILYCDIERSKYST